MGVIFGWLRRPKLAKKLRFYEARKKSGRRYATIAVKLLKLKSSAIRRYLWLAEAAKIGDETTILRRSKKSGRRYATIVVKLLIDKVSTVNLLKW